MVFMTKYFEESETWKMYNPHLNPTPLPGCETAEFKSREYFECYARHITCNKYIYILDFLGNFQVFLQQPRGIFPERLKWELPLIPTLFWTLNLGRVLKLRNKLKNMYVGQYSG